MKGYKGMKLPTKDCNGKNQVTSFNFDLSDSFGKNITGAGSSKETTFFLIFVKEEMAVPVVFLWHQAFDKLEWTSSCFTDSTQVNKYNFLCLLKNS